MPSLSGVIKQASRGADLYFVFRFLRLLTMDWKKTDAYKYKIIDAKGKALRKSSELETVDEKAGYTMLHRMVFKIRRLIEKVPLIGKSILLNYAAALFLLKEQDNKRIWTDENYMERELNKFLESDWEEEAEGLKEAFQGQYGKTQTNEFLTERKMTDAEIAKREEIVLKLKKKEDSFRTKYGDKWKDVIYATATKMAMGEERNMKSFTEFQLDEIKFEAKEIIIKDPHTIQFITHDFNPYLPDDFGEVLISSKKAGLNASTADYQSGKAAIGTGPFKVEKHIQGEKLILQRNENYYGKKPEWNRVEYVIISDDAARVAALLSGDVDLIDGVPPLSVTQLENNKNISVFKRASDRIIYFFANQRGPTKYLTDKNGSPL